MGTQCCLYPRVTSTLAIVPTVAVLYTYYEVKGRVVARQHPVGLSSRFCWNVLVNIPRMSLPSIHTDNLPSNISIHQGTGDPA